ncbi:MAG: hypothetical protein HY829_08635 [Actinobacteria bacterium]|nr:hypothetical protein [Actinomycetota bacterium]
MQYLLLTLVLAIIITASVVAWMRMTGGDDGVAEAELLDISDPVLALAARQRQVDEATTRHAVATITARHIPLVSLRRGPRIGQAWLHYADGTDLLAEERVLGALGFLAFDLVMHGPTSRISVAPLPDGCWVTVGRRNTRLRLIGSHHPEALLGT